METKLIWDGTDAEMERLIEEKVGLFLVEVQNHSDGNFLIFADKLRA